MPVTRPHQTEREKTLLWVTGDPSENRALIEEAGHEFKLAVRFCVYSELWVRAEGCDVVAIELDDSPSDALGLLKALHDRMPRLTLFAASEDNSVPMMRAAIEGGANDFLSLPLNTQELHKALIRWTQASTKSTTTRGATGDVISIYGARGGLGATTLAVNLAVRMAALTNAQVGLVDLDLQRGDVAAFLNLVPAQTLASFAAAHGEIDDFFLNATLTRHSSGVFVLGAPLQIEEADTIGREQVEVVLRLLRSRFHHTVVDTARTLTDATLAAFDQASRILLLTDLSVPGVRAARRTLELLTHLQVPPERVELLVTAAIPGAVSLEDAVRALGKEPLLTIPRDQSAATQAMNSGAPLNGTRDSNLAISITQLAAKLTGVSVGSKGGGRHLLRRIFGRGRRANA